MSEILPFHKLHIDTKTWQEDEDNRGRIELDVSYTFASDNDIKILHEIKMLQKDISELVSFKLELLNEWDFTHGDDSLQNIFSIIFL